MYHYKMDNYTVHELNYLYHEVLTYICWTYFHNYPHQTLSKVPNVINRIYYRWYTRIIITQKVFTHCFPKFGEEAISKPSWPLITWIFSIYEKKKITLHGDYFTIFWNSISLLIDKECLLLFFTKWHHAKYVGIAKLKV